MDQRTITTTSIQQVATGLLEMGQQLQRVANAEAFRDATAAEQVRRMQTAEQARRMQTAKKVRRIPTAEMIRKMPKVQYAGTRRYGQLHPRVDRSRGGHPQSSDERESDTRGSRQVQDPKTAQRVIELPYGRPIQSLSAGIPRPIPPTVQIFQPPLFPFMVAPVPQARITARHASPALAPTMTVSRTPAVPAPPARTTRTTAAATVTLNARQRRNQVVLRNLVGLQNQVGLQNIGRRGRPPTNPPPNNSARRNP